jgi:predicted nuclease of restriction endonuclease-like (RecB) superfamily
MKDFKLLVDNIAIVHNELQQQAANTVNQLLTVRNWMIGYYIVEYEQNGKDRAEYGKKILLSLSKEFECTKGLDERAFRNFRLLYNNYPQVGMHLADSSIRGSLTTILENLNIVSLTTQLQGVEKRGSLTTESNNFQNRVNGKHILTKLSYTHLEQLIKIKEDFKRTFYEIECIKGIWSVRELKRQIASLYYERSGLSVKPEKLSELINNNLKPQKPTDIIKNIYAFEFLDLNIKDAVEESDLETALLDHLQDFIIELGNGFCFEKRQKRILIGENYYFIDLVFYHRILKCHVILELKIGSFEHGDIGQLNTYLNYFKEEISEKTDNAPVGILLVAGKDNALVKFATAGMDKNLFVQQYLVQLPSKEYLEKYINHELTKLR